MKYRKFLAGTIVLAVGLTASACTQSLDGPGAEASGDTLKIGYVSPVTGPLAGFGEADAFVIDQMKEHYATNELKIGDKSYKVEIIVKDAQSDSKRAGEVAADLINSDGVDLVLSTGTPDITNPVADQCEANATPCITTVAPWQPYFLGRGGTPEKPFNWTYHFFWGLEDVATTFEDMWGQVETNKQVGALFPNDTDGQAWAGAFPEMVTGYTFNNPGAYTNGTQDFSAQVGAFKGSDIVIGLPIPPDFTTFWKQAKQQGLNPKMATIGKALLFPSSIEALGDIGHNLGTEVWWTPQYPFNSSLTDQSAADLAAAYEEKTGKQWTQPLGFSHALFEVADAALVKAGSRDKQAVSDALKTLTVDTVVGDLDFGNGPVPGVAKTPLAGGQWRKTDGGKHPYELVIVSNKVDSSIPVAGNVEPLG